MKTKILPILLLFLIFISCSGNIKNDKINKINSGITIQTIAAFKSAENVYENEWKLIFRKVDDCQYIIFFSDINLVNSFKDNLILLSENKYITNPDYVNLRFSINYAEEKVTDGTTGENIIINRVRNINRIQSDRYSLAGFDNDKIADDFIISLKNYIKSDSVIKISEMISYPLILITNKRKSKINEPELFVKNYKNIFNAKVKNSILNQPVSDVKAGSNGLIIGKGEILINLVNGKISITTVKTY